MGGRRPLPSGEPPGRCGRCGDPKILRPRRRCRRGRSAGVEGDRKILPQRPAAGCSAGNGSQRSDTVSCGMGKGTKNLRHRPRRNFSPAGPRCRPWAGLTGAETRGPDESVSVGREMGVNSHRRSNWLPRHRKGQTRERRISQSSGALGLAEGLIPLGSEISWTWSASRISVWESGGMKRQRHSHWWGS